jgi:1-acyl-sn-glycerol-3-phosphate acyltransferase
MPRAPGEGPTLYPGLSDPGLALAGCIQIMPEGATAISQALPAQADRGMVERRTLEIVAALVRELGTLPVRGSVALDDTLDRDLGIGSLERVELFLRLEEAFGARLGDTVMAEAETCRDLVEAILGVGEGAQAERLPTPGAIPATGVPAPTWARTLPEILRWHAEREPERVHILLRLEDGREQPITYGALWSQSLGIAAALRDRGVGIGESVALMLRTEPAFFPAFFGIVLAGAVPVPIYPPFRPERLGEYAARQVGILRNAEARLLVTFREAQSVATLLRIRVPSLREVVPVERLEGTRGSVPPITPGAEAPALIQYTSGSTGDPKGVVLTHANLLANIRALGAAVGVQPDDVMVSWLPLYHDMGLIGAWLGALYHGVPTVILSPVAFLARPARWLWALHTHRGTLSPAPNFAFDLCARRISAEEIEGLDLSAWRVAFNGSEAVSPETIERFTRRFAAYGFKPETMCPVYGLAESSVGLTLSPPGRGPRIDRVARPEFERQRRAEPAASGEVNPLQFVSCGRPLAEHEVRIVDPAGQTVPERVEGRVEFRGPSVTRGYFGNPKATRAAFHDGWMDSGDLGYRAEGELYITGRQKDIIIKAGRNLYPQEIEEVVGGVEGIRKGCVAAFGVTDPDAGTERLVVVGETRHTAPEDLERLRAAVRERIVDALGLPPDTVVLGRPGIVLKTSSGKIRRSATRAAYLSGTFGRQRRSARQQWVRLVVHGLGARLGRLATGALSVLYAAWVGVLLLVTVPLLWILLVLLRRPRGVDRAVRLWCRGMLTLSGCRLRVEGLEHLPAVGGVVLAANHSSYLDVVVLLAAIPLDFRFVAKKELLKTPIVGRVIRKVGHLTVDRVDLSQSVADAERVTAALRTGTSLLVFPEGTFVRRPGLLPFRLGAFKAATETGCPVIPVTIDGTREVLPPDSWMPCRGTIEVKIGLPVEPPGREWRDMVQLRDRIRAEVASRLEPVSPA